MRGAAGLEAQWIETRSGVGNGVILYLHGGGFTQSSPKVHHSFLARLCVATGRRGLYVEYRLAPEHPFPAALDDTVSAYRWLIAQGIDRSKVIIAGDSAGAGLALSAMVQIRESGLPLPAAAVLLCPMCELTLSSPSASADKDPIYTRRSLLRAGQAYAGDRPLSDPRLSPINADLSGLPPILIQAGELELFLDDAITLAGRVRGAGGEAELSVYHGLWHGWQLYPGFLVPESRLAVGEIALFILSH